MSQKRLWVSLWVGGGVLLLGCGTLIYRQYKNIEKARLAVEGLRLEIDSSRTLLTGTPKLEREVIVLRETEEAIKEILPDEEDLNNFVRGLRRFEEDAEVRITGLKKKAQNAAGNAPKQAFEPVTYTLTLEGDAFQYLSFLDRVENHKRFMRVPNFKLVAAPRRDLEEQGVALHRIQMDVETYAYAPSAGPTPVKIEGYDHKRELLLGEISRSRQELTVKAYEYRGPRGRRDPWVDPRIPVVGNESGLSVEEQITAVEALVQRMEELEAVWAEYELAENVIAEMTLRADVDSKMSELESDARGLQEEGAIRFVPSARRLQLEVLDPLKKMRDAMAASEGGRGPSIDNLNEVLAAMERHIKVGEFDLSLQAYGAVKLRLDYVIGDPEREALAEKIKALAAQATVASEFQKLRLDIRGRALMEGAEPVVLIDGRTLGEGDLVTNDLVITAIRSEEIEFIYRGVVLIRPL